MQRGATANSNADCANFLFSYPGPGQSSAPFSRRARETAHSAHDVFQARHQTPYAKPSQQGGKKRIRNKLPWPMIRSATAALGFHQRNTAFRKKRGVNPKVVALAAVAKRN